MCINCDTATYNMTCINCLADWILRLDKSQRLFVIENQGRHDVEKLKKLIIEKNGRG